MAAPPKSKLDSSQVLPHAFDEVTGRLRTDSLMSPAGGATEVIIDHADDSIKIGDGTDLVTTTTENGSVGLDVHLTNTSIAVNAAGTPTILNQSAPVAGTEYSISVPINSKKVTLKARNRSKLQFSFTSGQTNSNYITIPQGSIYELNGLNATVSFSIYFQASKAAEVVEVIVWT